jgi:hypothetical protein
MLLKIYYINFSYSINFFLLCHFIIIESMFFRFIFMVIINILILYYKFINNTLYGRFKGWQSRQLVPFRSDPPKAHKKTRGRANHFKHSSLNVKSAPFINMLAGWRVGPPNKFLITVLFFIFTYRFTIYLLFFKKKDIFFDDA